ncbi:MAG TPA: YceI family protein [Puia sp.]|nr:YceI family protein [Puia sp.]
MKKTIIFSLLTITGIFASDRYKPEDQGSSVQFKIKNLGFSVNGSFSGLDGNIQFNPNDLTTSNFDVSIDANTVNTDNNMRDNHLRSETYFDVKNYPRIRFVSTKITSSNNKEHLFMFGKLTIKNQTKDISFPFTATLTNEGYLFNGTFRINRRDFNVGGTSTISDELEVSLNILSKKT